MRTYGKVVTSAVLYLATLLPVACTGGEGAKARGKVIDRVTGKLIEGADGYYTIEGLLPMCHYEITYSKAGYLETIKRWEMEPANINMQTGQPTFNTTQT
jgi:hypothetical protein